MLVGARVERPAATLLAATGFLGATILAHGFEALFADTARRAAPAGVTRRTA